MSNCPPGCECNTPAEYLPPCSCGCGAGGRVRPTATCRECGRVFDLTDENDAGEWAYGHDCEA